MHLTQYQLDKYFMSLALEHAFQAQKKDEVPIASLIVDSGGVLIAKSYNLREKLQTPLSHAELLCINKASKKINNWRLNEMTLYVTLEPCLMCISSLYQARIKRVVFGAYDFKAGALSLGYLIHKDPQLNHSIEITGGILESQCGSLISSFFKSKRQEKK